VQSGLHIFKALFQLYHKTPVRTGLQACMLSVRLMQ